MDNLIKDLKEKLSVINSKRIGLLIQNILVISIFTILYFVLAFYIQDHFNLNRRIIRYAALPVIYFLYSSLRKKKKAFNQLYNKFFIEDIIRGFYPSWLYSNEPAIDPGTVYQTCLIKKGDDIDITNYISGDIGNTNFSFAELKVVKNQYFRAKLPKKLFHGYFFVFNNNKYSESKLYVKPSVLYDFGSLDTSIDQIKSDSSEFDKRFTIYSNDPIKARYILTPALMARILDFENKYKNKISFLFDKDKLYIAFKEYKNLLEPALRKRISINTINMQLDIFKLIGLIVEELNMDNDIWLKQKIVQGGL